MGFLTINLDRKWSAASLSRHLQDITILYRWELINDSDEQQAEKLISFLTGANLDNYLKANSFPDLYLRSLNYGSPTTEVFEGTVRGLSGVASLIEKLLFFKHTKQLKDLEIRERQLLLMNQKIDTINKLVDSLKKFGASEDDVHMAVARYGGSIEGISALIEQGFLTKISFSKDSAALTTVDGNDGNDGSRDLL